MRGSGGGEMRIVLTTLHVIDLALRFTWPIILFAECYFRTKDPYRRRTQRGRHYKWTVKQFGFLGPAPLVMGGWTFALACIFTPAGRLGNDVVLIYLAGALVIDWITGSDDPPYKRWLASLSEAVKKLKISPPPRPVIESSLGVPL